MNRKIITSIVSSGVMLSLVVGATFAYFSNAGTSSANTFSTGTLDLKLTDANETTQDSVTSSFGGALVPGQCTGPQTLNLRNAGTVAANHAEVTVSNVVTDANNDASPDMDRFLRIETLNYDGGSVLGQITSANATAFVDLHDWASNPNVLDNLPLADLNTDHPLVMDVCLDASAGNGLQGDSVVTTFTVTLNQDSSQ